MRRAAAGIACLAALMLAGPASADDTAAIARGATIATQGAKTGAPACTGCHGAHGEGQAASGFPRLAGLKADYLVHELEAFTTPARKNAVMSGIAVGLDPAARRDVAAYYASLAPQATTDTTKDPQAAAGSIIAARGDWAANIPPCASCHGRDGLGIGVAFPAIAGQNAHYVAAALSAWKDGSRRDDPQNLMGAIAKRLTTDQVAAVAAYYATLSPVPGKGAAMPPPESAIPDDDFGKVVREGEAIFDDPKTHAGTYVGNSLTCANCHLESGRRANSAPLGAAYLLYPAYRAKTGRVNTFAERLQGCFRYSMNGKAPPLGDRVLVALESYAFFLAKGSPVGTVLPGRGYPKLPKPAQPADFSRGATVFAGKCAICHGPAGAGQKTADGATAFPALWGPDSFNWGAGMESLANASGFIKANMPLGQGGSLTDQEAWDVALFMDGHERPQDPRFTGDVAATRKQFHDTPMSMYGKMVDGKVLGAPQAITVTGHNQ